MVSKAKSIRGSIASIDYILNDKENGMAQILDKNGIVGNNGKEIIQEFRLTQEANTRCQKNTISAVISPSDERKFTPNQMKQIGQEWLKQMRLDKNQYLMTLHNSTGKPHIHIIANRIDNAGKAYKDNFISLKGQKVAENMAKKLGLKTAKEVEKINKEITKEQLKPIVSKIRSAHNFATKKAYDFSEYKDLMHGKGINVIPTINKQGQLKGMKFLHRQSGLEFKSSQIGKDYGVKNLLQSKVDIPTPLSTPLAKVALSIAKMVVRTASKGMGIGF